MTDHPSIAASTTFVPPGTARAQPALPLLGMRAHARLDGLLFELTVEQRYQNTTDRPIEAIFTFAVPLRAVLLGLELELGDRKLEAVAMARVAATETYERAIDAGDAAVLLESRGNGQWTVSVGNLKPGETALIRYRHAELLDANRGYLRLTVPTAIAPRYGDTPQTLQHQAETAPTVDWLAEYPFDIRIELAGLSQAAGVQSPTHGIVVAASSGGLQVTLAREARMDRDFVLEVEQALVPAAALVAEDTRGAGWVSVASVVLADDQAAMRPLALKLLIDCSGSMGGDSIDAAKRAVLRALDQLDGRDHLSVQRFGSSVESVTSGMVACSDAQREALRRKLAEITADLGGTEMAHALQAALSVKVPKDAGAVRDLLVITDGEIEAIDDVVALAATSGHRLFVVAVGAAPVEALARRLADETGGACEFVAAGELAEEAVLRMFRRLRAPPRRVGAVTWPCAPQWTVAAPTAVFAGETLHLVAGFSEKPVGVVQCEVIGADGVTQTVRVEVGERVHAGDLLARVAAMRRVSSLVMEDRARATQLAVDYQLATTLTSFVVVAERSAEEKSKGLPATINVPHMLAAGWGGTSRMPAPMMVPMAVACRMPAFSMDHQELASTSLRKRSAPAGERLKQRDEVGVKDTESMDDIELDDVGLDLGGGRVAPTDTGADVKPAATLANDVLARILDAVRRGDPMPTSWRELGAFNVPVETIQRLQAIAKEMWASEAEIVRAYLAMVLADPATEPAIVAEIESRWPMRASIWTRGRQRKLRAAVRERVLAS